MSLPMSWCKMSIVIELDFYGSARARAKKSFFTGLLPAAYRALVKDKCIRAGARFLIELSIVGNKEITFLNKIHHRKNRATDVISLSYFDAPSPESPGLIGEIFICFPYARLQAKRIGQPLNEEFKFLFVHGLLHIFGYDHKKPLEEKKMLRMAYGILGRG